MSDIRLVNATTRMPVDSAIEDAFFAVLDARFAAAVIDANGPQHVDVLMVMRDDPDLMRRDPDADTVDIDWLGIFMPHAKGVHRAMLKLSPERVLEQATRMHATHGKSSLRSLYLTLLSAALVHELAHCLMDGRVLAEKCPLRDWKRDVDWRAANNRLLESYGPAVTGDDTFEDDPVLEAEMLTHQRQRDAAQDSRCEVWNRPIPGHLRQLRSTVEESLANGFVLMQNWNSAQRRCVADFIGAQSYEHRLGFKWAGTLEQTLQTGASWSAYKRNTIGIAAESWKQADRAQQRILEELVERLARPGEKIMSYDFSDRTASKRTLDSLRGGRDPQRAVAEAATAAATG
jgi:hypothetical protein